MCSRFPSSRSFFWSGTPWVCFDWIWRKNASSCNQRKFLKFWLHRHLLSPCIVLLYKFLVWEIAITIIIAISIVRIVYYDICCWETFGVNCVIWFKSAVIIIIQSDYSSSNIHDNWLSLNSYLNMEFKKIHLRRRASSTEIISGGILFPQNRP